MFAALQAQYPDQVGPVALDEGLGGGQVNKGRDYANIYVYGVNENYLPLYNIEVIAGRNLRAKDNEGARNVAVVSDKLVNNMFRRGYPRRPGPGSPGHSQRGDLYLYHCGRIRIQAKRHDERHLHRIG